MVHQLTQYDAEHVEVSTSILATVQLLRVTNERQDDLHVEHK